MAAELIGRCRCPVCGSDKARLSLAKSQLVVATCNGCNFQGFARSGSSDEKLRALLIAEKPAAPAEPVRTAPATPPTPPAPPAPVRTAVPAAPAPAAPVRTADAFGGLLDWINR